MKELQLSKPQYLCKSADGYDDEVSGFKDLKQQGCVTLGPHSRRMFRVTAAAIGGQASSWSSTSFLLVATTRGRLVPWVCYMPMLHGLQVPLAAIFAQLLPQPKSSDDSSEHGLDSCSQETQTSMQPGRAGPWAPLRSVTPSGCWQRAATVDDKKTCMTQHTPMLP